jgi:cytochrome c biogenesis protein CcmG/thiol:disulfide interchange protein DsbE
MNGCRLDSFESDAQGGLLTAHLCVPGGSAWLRIVLVLLVVATSSACRSGTVSSGPAPDFSLESSGGDSIALSDLEGQVVVLDFWATWCSPCVESLDHLQQLHELYADQGVVVLAINVGETQDEVAGFVAHYGYTFSVLLDTDDRVTDRYGVQGIPHTLVVDRNGEIHSVPGGPDAIEGLVRELLREQVEALASLRAYRYNEHGRS